MSLPDTDLIQIAVVAFNQISPFHLSVPSVVFGEALQGEPVFALKVCSADNDLCLTTSAGYSLVLQYDLQPLKQAQIIIVPSWRNPNERPPEALLAALNKAYQRGATIVGLCLGAYVLAEAGLLTGRKATTHWAYADDFSVRYPEVQLNADILYVEYQGIMTSAGTAAGIDCCLQMLRQQLGADRANRVARRLVVPPHRQGGQRQYIDRPLPTNAQDNRLNALLAWVRSDLSAEYSIDYLANKALMSRRTFTRHFRAATGTTFGNWLLHQRLGLCQQLLERTDQPIESIASHAGFGSVVSMRQHFRQVFGVSPTVWRQTFRV
ncbi:Transcriptional regulator GlxA family, contains an amidase domain and an AraC-type DNA-binding HTH domain [Oceanospirillum multiglobuliferum]|uniref:GlxA family transcriptional regulator n=1 Tax=Oceanospirillum multiglobuliferum TaxID=64969 RepID=UPI0009C896DE|nr:helix-turn-helix domain-containing protein [Oceanospirillum multiglobuliferum]SKA08289.1 Transcriptional regulator GlxA family, contains an amidase domain and an AraC-type DNA-binding HTH domain [Oceanospirillum multiglobuliferum]